jgi:hypothetical protein
MAQLLYYNVTASGHEDLIDEITMITPELTPFLSMAQEGAKPGNRTHQWPHDVLEHPSGASTPQISGFSFSSQTLVGRTRLLNYVETQAKQIDVEDDLDEYVNVVGQHQNEFDYQLQKKMAEMALSLEYRIWSAATGVSGASGTASQIKAIPAWITTNKTTATADRAVTRALMDGVLEDIFAAGGKPKFIFCREARKTGLSGIIDTGYGTRQLPSSGGRVVQTVDVYEGSFGVLSVKPCVYMVATDIYYILEMTRWRISWGVRGRLKRMGKVGDTTRAMLKTTFTLEARAEESSGKVEDIS